MSQALVYNDLRAGFFVSLIAFGLIVVVLDFVHTLGAGNAAVGVAYTLAAIVLSGLIQIALGALRAGKLSAFFPSSVVHGMLAAIGMGNTLCGLVGGLPMIAEIVRSSSNISYGAQSAWSNFFHGLFLLLFISLGANLIQEIPLASLAALLVYTGFRLASPMEFAKTLSIGFGHFLVFVVTLISILLTDLLLGVLIGIACELALHGLRGLKPSQIFQAAYHIDEQEPGVFHVLVHGAAVFSNFIALKSMTGTLPKGKQVIFDLSEANLIDSTVLEFIYHFRTEYRREGGNCEIAGLHKHHAVAKHPLSVRRALKA